MSEFRMPSLGSDMKSGTLYEWKIRPGDIVKRGDVVAVVETDKGAIDMEIWEDGKVQDLIVQTGENVPVGTVLAKIESTEQTNQRNKDVEIKKEEEVISTQTRKRVTPLARKVAEELHVDISKIQGSGIQGTIVEQDVLSASFPPEKHAVVSERPYEKMRRAIASAMEKSKLEIPHYYLSNTIDMSIALKWLEKENLKRSISERLIYAVLLTRAVAKACQDYPEMNGFWQNYRFIPGRSVNIGMGISLKKKGLIAPALMDAEKKNLDEHMQILRDLTERARNGGLKNSEMTGATITVTNLGELGVEQVFGIIYPPQVALVGFGKISPNKTLISTLAADHRVSDGYRGGQFLMAISDYLQEPEKL